MSAVSSTGEDPGVQGTIGKKDATGCKWKHKSFSLRKSNGGDIESANQIAKP